jgi:hypothetical protein
MSPRVTSQLPGPLLNLLQTGCPALLLTIGPDGLPHTAYTWLVALEATTIRFAADHGSTTLANLEREWRASLQIIAQGNFVFLIKGTVRQVKPQIEAAPFKMAMMALQVSEVKNQAWPGVSVQPLAYEWTPDRREKMVAMERAVYDEMGQWND